MLKKDKHLPRFVKWLSICGLLVIVCLYTFHAQTANANISNSPWHPYDTILPANSISSSQIAPLSTPPPPTYDEQLFLVLDQNSASLSYNVTAIAQTDVNGYGPAYLLNGMSNDHYWYQIGLSYDWPYASGGYASGFNLNYEVFNSNRISIYPADGGGLQPFSGPVNSGDLVQLNLNINGGVVYMTAYDWNTSSTSSVSYTDIHTSEFIAGSSDGFFTGLMTEWYHVSPYYGDESAVNYTNYNSGLSSGWMCMDEWQPSENTVQFDVEEAVTFSSNPTQLQYYFSNGATEYGSAYQFTTGSLQQRTTVMLFPAGTSNQLSSSDYFEVTFTLYGQQSTMFVQSSDSFLTDVGSNVVVSGVSADSSSTEEWMLNSQGASITVPAGSTTTWSYYDLLSQSVAYSVLGGGNISPMVTYYTAPSTSSSSSNPTSVSTALPISQQTIWALRGTAASVTDNILGTAQDRWATPISSWTINQVNQISDEITYYHQYQLSAGYATSDGSTPSASVVLSGTQFGNPTFALTLSTAPQNVWLDVATGWSINNPVTASGTEQWIAISGTSGTVSSSASVTPLYYHQYNVGVDYSTSDGSTPSAAVILSGTQSGNSAFTVALTTEAQDVWLNAGAAWRINNPIAASGTEQWVATSETSGTVGSATSIAALYYHQYEVTASYATSDASTPSSNIKLYGTQSGNSQFNAILTTSPQKIWLDAETAWGTSNPIVASSTEQWVATLETSGTVTHAFSIDPTYIHQFYLTVVSPAPANVPTSGSGWYNAGSTAYAGLASGTVPYGAGAQLAFAGWSNPVGGGSYQQSNPITMNSAVTVTALWNLQYYLTVSSAYGSVSGIGWYNAGATANFGVTSQVSVSQSEQYVFASWTGSGSGSYSGTGASGSCQMNAPLTESASWNTQYYLTVTSSSGAPTGGGWYESGSSATFSVSTPFSGGIGTQYVFSSWNGLGAGSYSGPAASYSLTINNAITETASWTTQYYLTVDDGGYGTATGSGWYNSGDSAQATVLSDVVSGGAGIQDVFSGWTGDASGSGSTSNGIIMNSPQTATATWATQYQLTLAVTPSGGGSTNPTGDNVWVDSGPLSISAFPGSGYTFLQWVSSNGSITFDNSNAMATDANVGGPGIITAVLVLTPSPTPTLTPTPTANPTQPPPSSTPSTAPSATPTTTPSASASPTPIPEFSLPAVLSILIIMSLFAAIMLSLKKRRAKLTAC